jgi:hypothetical protein
VFILRHLSGHNFADDSVACGYSDNSNHPTTQPVM